MIEVTVKLGNDTVNVEDVESFLQYVSLLCELGLTSVKDGAAFWC